ncbi:MAG: TldD/PmbA family protein [Alphaproteobacteria bacterium]|nr:TldD/PmbA family protein [Alphaproteobacteria bacterium]
MTDNSKSLNTLEALLDKACRLGADAGDAAMIESIEVQASCRRQLPEGIERSESAGISLRVWSGARQAMVSSTDLAQAALFELAERAVAMARAAPEDPSSTLAPEALLARRLPALNLYDKEEPASDWLMRQAMAAEQAALDVPGVTNSEGGHAGYGANRMSLMTRPPGGSGFAHSYRTTMLSLSVSALAGEGTQMERDYDYATVRHRADLPAAEAIGRKAAERAVKRLHPRKVPTGEVPVVFDPRNAKSLLSYFAGAINGAAIARGTSFLKEKLGQKVFSHGVTICDDPHRPSGLGSRPFDGEGVANRRMDLVEDGVLVSWLLDVRSAHMLGLNSTGHATRGMASAPSPSPSNLWMQPGEEAPEALMADIKAGLYVTEMFGMGVNLVTGDFSQGAAGFWIENGALAYPVSELTIAGNLNEMFAAATPANDLEFRYAINAPTVHVARMTVAGT